MILLERLLNFAGNPVPCTSADRQVWVLDDHPDLVKASLMEVVGRVTEQVLAMEIFVQVLDRFVQSSVVIKGVSFSSRKARESLERIVSKDILDRLENIDKERHPVAQIIVLVDGGRR